LTDKKVGGQEMEMFWILCKAFIVGGLICVIGQLLIDYTKLTPARILVGFVITGVILGGLGVYDILIDFAGSGATVPLSGFGHALAEGTKKAIKEEGLLGVISGPIAAGSVGIMAALISGLIVSFVKKPKEK
jgi:stage V sporulation protein AE